ncbi:hypothetical protein ACLB2K_058638 [Fragaria x ananassa]
MCEASFSPKNGWYCCFCLNPVTGARIVLPSHLALSSEIKAVVSSVPSETGLPRRRRCYVCCLIEDSLAFRAPGDESWTSPPDSLPDWDDIYAGFHDIEIVDGKLYAVGRGLLEFLIVFDIQVDAHGYRNHTCTAQKLVTLHHNVDDISEFDDQVIYQDSYLAKGSESKELFMILHNKDGDQWTRGFQVTKLEDNVATGPRWVEIDDLGDQVLFIYALNYKFVSLGSTSHDKTLQRNSIYLVFDCGRRLDSGVFSLRNKSIQPLNIPKEEHLYEGIRSVWYAPNS